MTSDSSASQRAAAAIVGELIRHLVTTSHDTTSQLVARLDDAVHVYEVEFRGYLGGRGHRPPVELGLVLDTAFCELAGSAASRGALSFRIEGLEGKFHAVHRLCSQRLARDDRRSLSRPETQTAA